ncbi:M48 family metallopeptidase [Corynebacterium choanae]|nr:SprT-like domain-containing protein [Corynebacterium choanae]
MEYATQPDDPFSAIAVIRSSKRRKTSAARLVGGRLEIRIPAHLSHVDEQRIVQELVGKMRRKLASPLQSDEQLFARAQYLNDAVLEGRARVVSLTWVDNQHSRWGSCSTASGRIRISRRLAIVPQYVLDSVIVHELVHTFIPDHSPEFWQWANRVPHAERARGFLEAYQRFGHGQ